MPEYPATPVRVYLSIVPGDAVPEREILTRDVFPELERRAAALGIAILLVHPEEDWDLARRFAAIDTCRLFVGILGERYGEPPPRIPDDLRLRHDWLADAGRSTDELEIRYALEAPGMRCLFYVREPDGLREDTEPKTGRRSGRSRPRPARRSPRCLKVSRRTARTACSPSPTRPRSPSSPRSRGCGSIRPGRPSCGSKPCTARISGCRPRPPSTARPPADA